MIGMGSAGSSFPLYQPPLSFRTREIGGGGITSAARYFTATSSPCLCLHLRNLLLSSFKKFIHHNHVASPKDVLGERALMLNRPDFLQSSKDAVSCLYLSFLNFSNGREGKYEETSHPRSSRKNISSRRLWTNIMLVLNVLVFVGQLKTQGKLVLWGAKINSLIDKGQIWSVEIISGSRRFLAVYFTSAIASSAMSYIFSRGPAVGASGAIFGLVGSLGVFALRHRHLIGGAEEDLKRIANVIILNMVIGVMSREIDNWGHLGGLLGGVVASWLIGPAWKYESMSKDGRRIFTDKAPISFIVKWNKPPRQ